MGIKQILGYICLAGAVMAFIVMYLLPAIRHRGRSEKNPVTSEREKRLIRIEERTGLMIPLQLMLIGAVLLS